MFAREKHHHAAAPEDQHRNDKRGDGGSPPWGTGPFPEKSIEACSVPDEEKEEDYGGEEMVMNGRREMEVGHAGEGPGQTASQAGKPEGNFEDADGGSLEAAGVEKIAHCQQSWQ